MKRKERFLAALGRKQPDRVPMFDFLFQQPLYEALIGRRPDTYNARDVVECALALDHDAVWLRSVNPEGWEPEYLAPDTYVDEWGTIFRHTDASWPYDSPIDYPIRTHEDLVQYRWPDPTLPGRVDDVKNFWKTQHDDLALTAGVTGPFTKAWFLMGYERICLALYDDPSMLEEIFRLSNEYFKEIVRRLIAAGCDAIWIQEDLGDNTRGFMKLNHFREHYFPYLADLAEFVDSLGVPVLLHCDGQINGYLPDLAQTKLVSLHPLQRTAGMDLRWVKENYGHRFCLIGNIDSSRTLPYGTAADVAAEVKQAIDVAAPGGGYVLASDHSLHDGIPVENVIELFRVGREYGSTFYGSK
jgi:uroporphyrinogen decarboxylase